MELAEEAMTKYRDGVLVLTLVLGWCKSDWKTFEGRQDAITVNDDEFVNSRLIFALICSTGLLPRFGVLRRCHNEAGRLLSADLQLCPLPEESTGFSKGYCFERY
jgi:hypothetical protein